jgi:hypothetical protein
MGCKNVNRVDEYALTHHRMVSLGYLGACAALTEMMKRYSEAEASSLPPVAFYTTESYVVQRINEKALKPYSNPVMRHDHDIYATAERLLPTNKKGTWCEKKKEGEEAPRTLIPKRNSILHE